jgi:DNA-binding MarR family transcriptional regulator
LSAAHKTGRPSRGNADLIERGVDTNDARSSWVRLSTAGVEAAERAVLAVLAASAAQSALLDRVPDATARLLDRVPDATARAANDALRELLIALGDQT